jgi:molecular chaperone GrpE
VGRPPPTRWWSTRISSTRAEPITEHDADLADQPVGEVQYDEVAAAPEASGEPAATDQPDDQVDLPTALAQRDEYLALARRVQADFENFRKRTIKQQQDQAAHATGRLVESLLPVLDAFDNAVIHGADGVAPLHRQLLDVLGKAGLEVVPTDGVPFDPNVHEAVIHEPGDEAEPVIVECLRTGYTRGGRTLRAAMVKVKG